MIHLPNLRPIPHSLPSRYILNSSPSQSNTGASRHFSPFLSFPLSLSRLVLTHTSDLTKREFPAVLISSRPPHVRNPPTWLLGLSSVVASLPPLRRGLVSAISLLVTSAPPACCVRGAFTLGRPLSADQPPLQQLPKSHGLCARYENPAGDGVNGCSVGFGVSILLGAFGVAVRGKT